MPKIVTEMPRVGRPEHTRHLALYTKILDGQIWLVKPAEMGGSTPSHFRQCLREWTARRGIKVTTRITPEGVYVQKREERREP